MTDLVNCLWCGLPFAAKVVGAHRKKFCSPSCNTRYHSASRQWVQQAFAARLLSVEDLKAAQSSCTTQGGA